MGIYNSYKELKACETHGKDYSIRKRYGKSGIAVMAPHGGGIEPGTTEIADAVAGGLHSFYTFIGLKQQGNAKFHISSTKFDEPEGIELAKNSRTILTIHGCKENKKIIYLGGKDIPFKEKIRTALLGANFSVRESSRFPGKNPFNICNQSRSYRGVQLEISAGLRQKMFYNLSHIHPKNSARRFEKFISALRGALSEHMDDLYHVKT